MTARDGDLSGFGEIAVVLGGGLAPDGSPNAMTLARADAAGELAERDLAFIVSGSHGDGPRPPRSEAAYMAERLVSHGIHPARIFLEEESRDTLANAAFVTERYLAPLTPRPLIVVTSPFHLRRALATFALVLGPSWPLAGHAAAPGEDEDAHAVTEERYLGNTRARLSGTTPGDIVRIAARVRAGV